jgi:hypothetical protein
MSMQYWSRQRVERSCQDGVCGRINQGKDCEEKLKTGKIKLVSSGLRDDNNSIKVLLRKL